MSITDMIISAIVKKGILQEARNVDMEFTIPRKVERGDVRDAIKIHIKADHMTLKVEKDLEEKGA